jgi:hypothetical protein
MTNVNVLSTENGAEMTVSVLNVNAELLKALAAHLDQEFEGHDDFIILDDSTKEDYLIESQEHMLWAFNTSFIMRYLKADISIDLTQYDEEQMEKSLDAMKEQMCESANGLIKGITDWEEMIIDGASEDGYGHFLNGYDGNEYEFEFEGETYYIYFNN